MENKHLTAEQKKENVKKWTSLFRRNINLYASRHLMIKLHPFQHIMLYLMGISEVFFAICSRGLSKTFIVGLYAVCKCLLFPYSEVHLTSSTINQASKMVKDKIEVELCKKLSPILKYYYDHDLILFHYNKESIEVEFVMNGSKMWVDPASDASRGGRATLLIYEECRLLKKTIIDSVFEKMAHPRQARYLTNPKYSTDKRWVEEAQSVYITSARLKQEWFWRVFKTVVEECYNNVHTEYNFFAGDIFLSIEFGLKTISDYFKAKKTSTDIEMRMEDLNEMVGEAEDAFFSYDMFKKNQISKKNYRFPTLSNIAQGDDLKNRPKQPNEVRLLWIDFAFANTTSKEENDYSIVGCTSIIPKDGKYVRCTDYITTHSAGDSDGMDLMIREMFWDYQADYIVCDLRNGGEIYFNDLTKPREHPSRANWNPHGFSVVRDEKYHVVPSGKIADLIDRTIDTQPIPCIIPIQGSQELNSTMWLDLQKRLRDEEVELLIDDIDFEQIVESEPWYLKLTEEERHIIKLPYVMTTSLVGEAINLSQEWKNGMVKLSEPRTGTKDIIVAYAYGNYISTLIINNLEQQNDNEDDVDLSEWAWLSR